MKSKDGRLFGAAHNPKVGGSDPFAQSRPPTSLLQVRAEANFCRSPCMGCEDSHRDFRWLHLGAKTFPQLSCVPQHGRRWNWLSHKIPRSACRWRSCPRRCGCRLQPDRADQGDDHSRLSVRTRGLPNAPLTVTAEAHLRPLFFLQFLNDSPTLRPTSALVTEWSQNWGHLDELSC